jgi:16S rRNA (guanine(966)-N(2))-methyltransferase RsmD
MTRGSRRAERRAAPKPVLSQVEGPARIPSGDRPTYPSGQGHQFAREVRIIGGVWKRSKLPVGEGEGLRPTPDRVRETLFNWLGTDLSGWRCLDAFAGSGALGFEAASRGADQVVMVERDRHLARALGEVKARLSAGQVRIDNADAITWMARCAADSFELVFLDPPFGTPLAEPALDAAARIVVPEGYVYFEAPQALEPASAEARGFRIHRQARAGAVHFHLLQRGRPA